MKYNKQDIIDYINNPTNEGYLTKVYPILQYLAYWHVKRFGRDYTSFNLSEKDLIEELVSHTAINLHNFDPKKSQVNTYISSLMSRYIFSKHQTFSYQKRDPRMVVNLESMVNDNDQQFELPAPTTEYSYYTDREFIQFYCDYWKNYKFPANKRHIKNYILFIISILENPEQHNTSSYTYTEYIRLRFNVSRQFICFIYKFMKSKSDTIRTLYDTGGMFSLIFRK